MSKIRILHFNDTLSKSSGVMSVIMNYYKVIDKNQIQFDFLYFVNSDNSYEDEIIKMGGNVIKINKPRLGKTYQRSLFKELKKIRDKYSYQTIHIHTPYLAFIIGKVAKECGFKNIIGHSHATTYSDHLVGKLRNFIIKHFMMKRYFTKYMTCSIKASDFLFGKKEYKNGNVYLLNNAIDLDKFKFNSDLRNRYKKSDEISNKIVLGHVGRMENQKNHLFLLKVFKELNKIKPNTYLLYLIGNGSLLDDVVGYVKKNNLDEQVIIKGFSNDVASLLNIFDIFLLPSNFEGLPVVAVEAQANGLPCLLSNKITKEVGINNTKFIDINSVTNWVDSILDLDIKRSDNQDKLIEANYEIFSEANKLLSYYQKLEGLI